MILIALSLYATQRLPSFKDQIKYPNKLIHTPPNITIFTAPNEFLGSIGAKQRLAIRSWLALSPQVTVVLFCQHTCIADSLGSRISVESDIDFTFLGTPFFHSMVARAQAWESDISVLIDPDIVLLPDFIAAVNAAYKLEHDWLLTVTSPNVSHFPYHLDESTHHWLHQDGKRVKLKKVQEFVAGRQKWSRCEEKMLMAWNTGEMPLHAGVLPPFLYGKGFHNQWVINEALSSDFRFLFDGSGSISSFHSPNQLVKSSGFEDTKNRSWEYNANSLLGALYGSLYFRGANFSNKLVKLIKCDGHYRFIDTVENVASPYREHGSLSSWKDRILRSRRKKKWINCVKGIRSLEKNMDCSFKEVFDISQPVVLPLSLESLLAIVAAKDKTIVLTIAGNNYRDMLMSWVCRLRQLQISNFVVCALDNEIYQFSTLQGLPVFKDPLAPSDISFNDCHFGTKCFQRVTKVKSRIVLQILKMGFNTLLSDVDVYWFKNPLPLVSSFGPGVIVAQSDEFNETGPINLPRRLNSGFYFAHSDEVTIAAMVKVVKHASVSDLSEQPSFYDVLCGEGGANRFGADRCLEPETNLTVHFLDRNLFPNGAYQGIWENVNVRDACQEKGCVILHNNWVSGRKRKLERQTLSGLWEYDVSTRICLHRWNRSKLKTVF